MVNELLTFQDWCVDTLCAILKEKHRYRGSLTDQGYKYTLKAIVDHFASMYYCGAGKVSTRSKQKEHINLWWDHLSEETRERFFLPLLMSEKACELCRNPAKAVDEFGGNDGLLHLEHITPKGYIYDKLCRLENPTRDSVSACFKHGKLVLLTKNESDRILDGKDSAFTQEDVNMLQKFFDVSKEELSEAQKLVGEKPKSKGSGLLRMIRLYHSDVKFVDSHNKPMPPDKWLAYLNNCENEIRS